MSLRYLLILACLFYLLVILFAYYSLVYHSESSLLIIANVESGINRLPSKVLPPRVKSIEKFPQHFPKKPQTSPLVVPMGKFIIVSSDVYVYSTHLDIRNPQQAYLRIMFLKSPSSSPTFWCHYPALSRPSVSKELSQPMTNLKEERFKFYEHCENHGMPYGGFMGVCRVPSIVTSTLHHFALTNSEAYPSPIENINPPLDSMHLPVQPMLSTKPPYKFGLCVPALFGDVNAQHLFEFISVVHKLGVQHITIYFSSAPADAKQVLQHFENQGILQTVPWNLPVSDSQTWNHAQVLSINDCAYRAMSLYEYVLFHDIDEYVVPRESIGTLERLADKYCTAKPNLCGICFLNAFFIPHWLPGQFRISTSLSRTSHLSTVRTKCLVQSKRIHEMGIHHISKPYQEYYFNEKINEADAILHHYRACENLWGMNCNGETRDETLLSHFQEANVEKQWLQFKTLRKQVQ
jgi:galactan beta-1,4-galactosyltransferase